MVVPLWSQDGSGANHVNQELDHTLARKNGRPTQGTIFFYPRSTKSYKHVLGVCVCMCFTVFVFVCVCVCPSLFLSVARRN